ncbi:hypothetical protein RHSIM_Rhsim09G0026100 [Rhododendron simsii]|uniref:Uncharacterized protein n=1 Tax=Rhododendron simsii TaxID=118357 RepID=A0A834LF11_RHOSS|nr:hypothetical protein RHSIM_Rhsim09G0026100 [Rhododendron simsii]
MSMPMRQNKNQKSVFVHMIDDEASMKELPLPNPLRGPYYNGYTSVVSLCSTTNGEVLFLWQGEGGVMAYNPECNSYRCVKSNLVESPVLLHFPKV